MKKLFTLLFATLLFSTLQAQQIKYKKADNGLSYHIVDAKKGPRIKEGDIVFLNLKYTTDKDSLLFDSWKMGGPIQIGISKPTFKGDLMDALKLLTVQDSAHFLFNADSLFEKTFGAELPPFIAKGSMLKFTVKVNRVSSEAELRAEEEKIQKQKEMEEKELLAKYIADNKLTPVTTPSGLMYVMYSQGTGKQAEAGKTVRVHYTGKLLNGTKFDSSLDRNDPLEFPLGQGMVIKGWEEGIALLKEGGKALLIIPSNLGYGARGAGAMIPPYSPLTFEVELISVQ